MQVIKNIVCGFTLMLVVACSINNIYAQSPAAPEYQLKATFLFHFTQFVTWPSSSFSSVQAPFIIGVIGNDPFSSYLQQVVAGENVNGHPIILQHYSSFNDIVTCHILFVNIDDKRKMGQDIIVLKKRAILLVSDLPNFLEQGGMVEFVNRNGKIKLRVNLAAAKDAELVISSNLLRLVEIFDPNK